jgi:hypothetical protein
MPIAEMQSHWVADLLDGRALLPARPVMDREITSYRAVAARRQIHSGRHAIQVDFQAYLRQIRVERRAGSERRQRAA